MEIKKLHSGALVAFCLRQSRELAMSGETIGRIADRSNECSHFHASDDDGFVYFQVNKFLPYENSVLQKQFTDFDNVHVAEF